jgi:hypothetical protein
MMTDDNPFKVIRAAIADASINRPAAGDPGGARDQLQEGEADRYARAVLLALEHNGFEIVRHTPEPPDDE